MKKHKYRGNSLGNLIYKYASSIDEAIRLIRAESYSKYGKYHLIDLYKFDNNMWQKIY